MIKCTICENHQRNGAKHTCSKCQTKTMGDEKKYIGYGYHGGGRKATGVKRVSVCISGQPAEIERLKARAQEEHKTVSRFILDDIK